MVRVPRRPQLGPALGARRVRRPFRSVHLESFHNTTTRAAIRDSRTVQRVADVASPGGERVRAAEVIAALSLATDLGIGVPLAHGLQSTLLAMRLGERLGVDLETASQADSACLLFSAGCTADAEVAAETFGDDDALTTYALPARFGSPTELLAGMMRALANSGSSAPVRALQIVRRMPRAAREFKGHVTAFCEVAQMLTDRLGLPASMQGLFAYLVERWDGMGLPGRARGEEIPLPVRIASVARDAAFQRMLGGPEFAAGVVRKRAGGAFDPAVAVPLADAATELLVIDDGSAWEETLACEPGPRLTLEGEAIDRALGAMGDFADLASPYLVGHSAEVAQLARAAAQQCRLDAAGLVRIRRGALVHDLGRVAVPVRIWQKAAPLTPDDWEQVRLHAYYSERILTRSAFLAALAPVASFHHERLDGSGYHRGAASAELTSPARLLAAADAHHIQNAYAKIGVSTRAAAALFAMQHGLTAWGELPIGRTRDRS